MRPIDADALAREIEKIKWNLQMLDDTQSSNKVWNGVRMAEKKVESAPTIDAEPVVLCEEDGTLWVTVEDCEKVGRVIIKNEQGHFCRVFYMGDGDEEPVRHGRWLEYGENKDGTHNIRCSKCGAGLKSKGHANSYYTKRKYRYCRNCGAKMDEVKDNED